MLIDEAHASNIDNNENVKYIYEYLRGLKDKSGKSILSPQHVAGIMGNMYQESHFNPEANSGTYKGLVQMSPGLWSYYETYLANNNLTNTVPNQLKYLGEIFTNRNNHSPFGIKGQHIYRNEWGGAGRQDKFITTQYKTAGEAAAAFADLFERQGAKDTTSRSNYADYIYGTYNYKQGGKIYKFQGGGQNNPNLINSEKNWFVNWFSNREPILKQNFISKKYDKLGFISAKQNFQNGFYDDELNNIVNSATSPIKEVTVAEKVLNPFIKGLHDGIYQKPGVLYLGDTTPETITLNNLYKNKNLTLAHELGHSVYGGNEFNPAHSLIKSKLNLMGSGAYKSYIPISSKYLDSPEEIYARLMAYRYQNNIDPKKKWTLDEIKNLEKSKDPASDLSRYSPEFLLYLFNDIAQNPNKEKLPENMQYVKSGGILKRAESGKSGIHIKPENKGKFTALKKRTGKSATWFKEHGTPAQKKMAVFALNAKKWNHGK